MYYCSKSLENDRLQDIVVLQLAKIILSPSGFSWLALCVCVLNK